MAFEKVFEGRVWIFGEDVDTDQILPGYAMSASRDELKNHAMSGSVHGDFAKEVEPGDIIVAQKNFGCGSSREQAPVALQQAGVAAVIAPSFARIFRRNCINIGLPVLRAHLFDKVGHGERVKVDIVGGEITILDTGEKVSFEPLSDNVQKTLSCGGLVNRVRMQLGIDVQEGTS